MQGSLYKKAIQCFLISRRGAEQAGFVYTYYFFLICFQVWINFCPFKIKRQSYWGEGIRIALVQIPSVCWMLLEALANLLSEPSISVIIHNWAVRLHQGKERTVIWLKIYAHVTVVAAQKSAHTPGFLIELLLWTAFGHFGCCSFPAMKLLLCFILPPPAVLFLPHRNSVLHREMIELKAHDEGVFEGV